MNPDNRAAILRHALRLFAARGYDAVGVQEIAEAAGVTKPTLYHYFGSKEGLLETLLAENLAGLLAEVEAAAAYHGDLTGTLTALTAAYFEFAREHATFYHWQLALVFAPPESAPARLTRQFNEAQHALLRDLFERAAIDHGNMRGRARRYAVTLRGMIDTYIGLALNGYAHLDDATMLRDAVHQFQHGIYS